MNIHITDVPDFTHKLLKAHAVISRDTFADYCKKILIDFIQTKVDSKEPITLAVIREFIPELLATDPYIGVNSGTVYSKELVRSFIPEEFDSINTPVEFDFNNTLENNLEQVFDNNQTNSDALEFSLDDDTYNNDK